MAALSSLKLPEPVYKDETVYLTNNCNKSIHICKFPILISFGVFDEEIIVDMSEEEAKYIRGMIYCAVDENSNICYLNQVFIYIYICLFICIYIYYIYSINIRIFKIIVP